MQSELYTTMANAEDRHWWFRGRRYIINHAISRLNLPTDCDVLDAGCGTGGNLKMLEQYGSVFAFELEEAARELAIARSVGHIEEGRLPDRIPFEDRQFDLIISTDVLEHVDDDRQSIIALVDRLKPGGYLLVTVPAFMWLWTDRDKQHHHFRRYHRGQLADFSDKTGSRLVFASYFNSLLFPLAAPVRFLQRTMNLPYQNNDLKMPPEAVNHLLKTVFAIEAHIMRIVPFPAGMSLMAVFQKQTVT